MGRFSTPPRMKCKSTDELVAHYRDIHRDALETEGWKVLASESEVAQFLDECGHIDVTNIESGMRECKIVLGSFLDRVCNEEDMRYGEPCGFDDKPTDEENTKIAAHMIALQMSHAGLTLSDIPMEDA